jgi:hypothetical protein
MFRGSPRHSESNGGVEQVNQTVQKKLSRWMKTNNSTHWWIGCKIYQWRTDTQVHKTLKDTPYHLTYGTHPRVDILNPRSFRQLYWAMRSFLAPTTAAGFQCIMSENRVFWNQMWNKHFNELKEYVAKHGNAFVTQIYPKNESLGIWVGNQRQFFKAGNWGII